MALDKLLASDGEDLPYLTPVTDDDILARNYSKLVEPKVALEAVLSGFDKDMKDSEELDVLRVKKHTKVARNLADAGHIFSKEQMLKLYKSNLWGAELIETGRCKCQSDVWAIERMHYHFYSHAGGWARDLVKLVKKEAGKGKLRGSKKAECVSWLENFMNCEIKSADLCASLDQEHATTAQYYVSNIAKELGKLTRSEKYRAAQIKADICIAEHFVNTNPYVSSKAYNRAAMGIKIPALSTSEIKSMGDQEFAELEKLLLRKIKYAAKSGKLVEETKPSSAINRYFLVIKSLGLLRSLNQTRGAPIEEVIKQTIHFRARTAELYSLEKGLQAGAQFAKIATDWYSLSMLADDVDLKSKLCMASCNSRKAAIKVYCDLKLPALAAKQKMLFGTTVTNISDCFLDDKIVSEAVDFTDNTYHWFMRTAKSMGSKNTRKQFEYFSGAVNSAKVVTTLGDVRLNEVWRRRLVFACDELLRVYKQLPDVDEPDVKLRERTLLIKYDLENPGLCETEDEVLAFECPECGVEVNDSDANCPGCDVAFEPDVFDEHKEL